MKTTLLTLYISLLFATGSLATSAFADQGHKHADKKAGKHEGGHMGHMNDVLQRLKQALGDDYDKSVPSASNEQLALGKDVFTKTCTACHGAGGKGDGPASAGFKQKPADFTDAEHSKFYSDQGRIYIIKKGIAGTPMPSWEKSLNEKEILAVHAYIRSLRKSAGNEKHNSANHAH
ncbi:hypothetical protein MNBD_GAMMA09-2587 [hydrothermal vent metagenome]|uniref:Cytochrome c domain-containing protein n=1 Tax=hydrothermal vent metagenome TaxID=652676 RepID=A0A3B0XPE3_9ZZZZ